MPVPSSIRALGPYYTVDILDQLPDDGNRYEVVYGELRVTPAPAGQRHFLASPFSRLRSPVSP